MTSGKRTEQRAATSQRPLPVSEVEGGRRLLLATSTQSPAALVRPGTTFSAVTGADCPVGERLKETFQRKLYRHTSVGSDSQRPGCRVRCLPVEVDWRGFAVHPWPEPQ